MTGRPEAAPRLDRLSALLAALAPVATPLAPGSAADGPCLIVTGPGRPAEVVLRLRPGAEAGTLAAARLDFAAPPAIVLRGLPSRISVAVGGRPEVAAIAAVLVAETAAPRCGSAPTRARLAEALLVLLLRGIIDGAGEATPPAGLLAGLAHPRLHRALVALHDDPARAWDSEALAARAGMSRTAFMAAFSATLGLPPGAYLASWRMQAGHDALRRGAPVKEAARRAGYGSPAAFSRAYRRAFGVPPRTDRAA